MPRKRGPGRVEHRSLQRTVEVYLDDEADPALAVAVRRHLDQCWGCSQDAEWLQLVKAALLRVGRRKPPELAVARLERFARSVHARPPPRTSLIDP